MVHENDWYGEKEVERTGERWTQAASSLHTLSSKAVGEGIQIAEFMFMNLYFSPGFGVPRRAAAANIKICIRSEVEAAIKHNKTVWQNVMDQKARVKKYQEASPVR